MKKNIKDCKVLTFIIEKNSTIIYEYDKFDAKFPLGKKGKSKGEITDIWGFFNYRHYLIKLLVKILRIK